MSVLALDDSGIKEGPENRAGWGLKGRLRSRNEGRGSRRGSRRGSIKGREGESGSDAGPCCRTLTDCQQDIASSPS
jgi:hypothetical protein